MPFLRRFFPIINWLSQYRSADFTRDAIAGLVVLFITVPQVIAYAFLAGLPPEAGLYAAVVALVCYAVFGSSRTLAVGPTAIIAIMTLEATSKYANPGSELYVEVAMKLALITGLVLLLLRLINFGAVISFLSHAVISGFVTAAAILIMTSQLPAILGLGSPPDTEVLTVLPHVIRSASQINDISMFIGIFAMGLLWFARGRLGLWLTKLGLSEGWVGALTKSAPMVVVVASICLVYFGSLASNYEVSIVGSIPTTLPGIQFSGLNIDELQLLAPSAFLIALVVFMESTSIGSAVASKRREKINPNQELIGLGVANVGVSIIGGFPVAGSFARTIVGHSSGAVSQVASLITAALVIVTLIWFALFFYHLPKAVLSAIIIMSAAQLIDWPGIKRSFTFNRADGVTFAFTFIAVLALGVESGILVGIAISFVLLIRNSSKPHIAVVGRFPSSEHFRNVLRHDVETFPHILAVRIDESLYFVNTHYIETFLLNKVAESEELEHIVLICTATNFIDSSGLEMLERLSQNLEEAGVRLHLAEVKGPVMDKLKDTVFCKSMKGQIFFTTHLAMKALAGVKKGKSTD